MKTLQEQYILIKEGKGNKDHFLKQSKNLFPEYINQYSDYNTTVKVLKSKSILSEGIGGVISHKPSPSWLEIFRENTSNEAVDIFEKRFVDDVFIFEEERGVLFFDDGIHH